MSPRLSPLGRGDVASRAAAAIVGGYAFTWLFAAAFALLLRHALSVARADSLLAASMASFLVYATIVMAVFRTRTAKRAWIGLIIASAPPALVLVFLYGRPAT